MSVRIADYFDIFLLIAIIASTRATTIQGVRSKYPCPICLVPNDRLWDLSEVIYPRRTRGGALRLVAKANAAQSKKAAKEILGGQSIRNVLVGYVVAVGSHLQ